MADQETLRWINQEQQQMRKEGWTPDSRKVTWLIGQWRNLTPETHKRLRREGRLRKTAEVCLFKVDQTETELLKSGMPRTDAREQAEREWLLLEEDEEMEDEELALGQ